MNIAAICCYIALGFLTSCTFARWSNKRDDAEFGNWRNPATPVLAVMGWIFWPIFIPMICLFLFFSWVG